MPTDPRPPDTVLIRRFQSGDAGAFDLLYLRHRDRIQNVIRSIVEDPDDALDLTQEVFLKAYQRLETFKHISQFYSWLYRIAVNQCIDHMRRRSKHSVLIDEPFREEIFCLPPVPPSAAVEREEFHRQLDAALPALTPCQRRVFVLRYNDELSLKSIARQLGRSTGTIKSHLFHARRTLHHQLAPYFQFAL